MNHIVLLEPEIPQNTGNISRTCVATATALHLIHPLGFQLTDSYLKRAGMDYWPRVNLHEHADWETFLRETQGMKGRESLFYLTTKGAKNYLHSDFSMGDCWFVFGKESAGIPETLLQTHYERCIRIPMVGETRSLNLSNSVAIILYEALRQQGFEGLNSVGRLHRLRP